MVFQKLQRKLILICTAGTAAVLVGMSLTALGFSLSRLRLQSEEAFGSNLNAVFYYLQAQPVVDQAWLSRTEADGGLLIDIRLEEQPLRYTGQNLRREMLCALAREYAEDYGYDPHQPPERMEPTVVKFLFSSEGESFRASVSSVPYRDGWLNVVILKSRSGELTLTRQIYIAFGCITVIATALLAVFAYYFTGRAIRPIRESHDKQREFVSAASHELRTPLAVMRLGIGLIKSNPLKAPKIAEQLDNECSTLSRLVDDLLLLARADDGRWSLQLREESPQTLLLTIYELFEPLAHNRGISLNISIEETVPSRILCDKDRMGQVLTILLDNALQYTPSGGAVLLSLSSSGKTVQFAVEDNGPGIPETERERVFDRFYRVDQSRSETSHHGLGLSIAKEIIELHCGSISIADAPEGGALFICNIPATAKHPL